MDDCSRAEDNESLEKSPQLTRDGRPANRSEVARFELRLVWDARGGLPLRDVATPPARTTSPDTCERARDRDRDRQTATDTETQRHRDTERQRDTERHTIYFIQLVSYINI